MQKQTASIVVLQPFSVLL